MPARHENLKHGKVSQGPDGQQRYKRVPHDSTDCDDEDSKITALELVYETIRIGTSKTNLEFLGDIARHEKAGRCSKAGWPNPGPVVQL